MARPADICDLEYPAREQNDDLLDRRLAMLGLDLRMIECGDRETFELLKRRCAKCGSPEACAADLKRDPNDPVWEVYCPNARALTALTEADWLAPILTNYWRRHYPQD